MAPLEAPLFVFICSVALASASASAQGHYESGFSVTPETGDPYYVIRPQHLLPPDFGRSPTEALNALSQAPPPTVVVSPQVDFSLQQQQSITPYAAVPYPNSPVTVTGTLVPLPGPVNFYKYVPNNGNKRSKTRKSKSSAERTSSSTSRSTSRPGTVIATVNGQDIVVSTTSSPVSRREQSSRRNNNSRERVTTAPTTTTTEAPSGGYSSSLAASSTSDMEEAVAALMRELLRTAGPAPAPKPKKSKSNSRQRAQVSSRSRTEGGYKASGRVTNENRDEIFSPSESRSPLPGNPRDADLPSSRDAPLNSAAPVRAQVVAEDDSPEDYDDDLLDESPARNAVDGARRPQNVVRTQSAGRTRTETAQSNSEEAARTEANSETFGQRDAPRRQTRPRGDNPLVTREETRVQVNFRDESVRQLRGERRRPSNTVADLNEYDDDYSEEDNNNGPTVLIQQTRTQAPLSQQPQSQQVQQRQPVVERPLQSLQDEQEEPLQQRPQSQQPLQQQPLEPQIQSIQQQPQQQSQQQQPIQQSVSPTVAPADEDDISDRTDEAYDEDDLDIPVRSRNNVASRTRTESGNRNRGNNRDDDEDVEPRGPTGGYSQSSGQSGGYSSPSAEPAQEVRSNSQSAGRPSQESGGYSQSSGRPSQESGGYSQSAGRPSQESGDGYSESSARPSQERQRPQQESEGYSESGSRSSQEITDGPSQYPRQSSRERESSSSRTAGRSSRERGQSSRERGQNSRERGQSSRERGQSSRDSEGYSQSASSSQRESGGYSQSAGTSRGSNQPSRTSGGYADSSADDYPSSRQSSRDRQSSRRRQKNRVATNGTTTTSTTAAPPPSSSTTLSPQTRQEASPRLAPTTQLPPQQQQSYGPPQQQQQPSGAYGAPQQQQQQTSGSYGPPQQQQTAGAYGAPVANRPPVIQTQSSPVLTNVIPALQAPTLQIQPQQSAPVVVPQAGFTTSYFSQLLPLLSLGFPQSALPQATQPVQQVQYTSPSVAQQVQFTPPAAAPQFASGPVQQFNAQPKGYMTIPPPPPSRSPSEISITTSSPSLPPANRVEALGPAGIPTPITQEIIGKAGDVEYRLTPSIRFEVDASDQVFPSRDDEPPRTISTIVPSPGRLAPASLLFPQTQQPQQQQQQQPAQPPSPTFTYRTIQSANPPDYDAILNQLTPGARNALAQLALARNRAAAAAAAAGSPQTEWRPMRSPYPSKQGSDGSLKETLSLVHQFATSQATGMPTVRSPNGRAVQFSVSPSQVHVSNLHHHPNSLSTSYGRPPTVLVPRPVPKSVFNSISAASQGAKGIKGSFAVAYPTPGSPITTIDGEKSQGLFRTIANIIKNSY